MFRFSFIVPILVLAIYASESNVPQRILVTVYYESKCSDSRDYIRDQLKPAMDLLHQYITLRLIPFGKAHNVNERSFECQHGETECIGNMMQSCALDSMIRSGYSERELVDYVLCEMETLACTEENYDCVHNAGVDADEVSECMSTDRGLNLMLDNEYLTNLVDHNFIPTITLDDTYNKHIQNSMFDDSIGTLCSYLKDTPPCAAYYNDMAMNHMFR